MTIAREVFLHLNLNVFPWQTTWEAARPTCMTRTSGGENIDKAISLQCAVSIASSSQKKMSLKFSFLLIETQIFFSRL